MKRTIKLSLLGILSLALMTTQLFAESETEVVAVAEAQPAEPACQVILAKGSCWLDYEVQVRTLNAATFEAKETITLPAGQSSVTTAIGCDPYEALTFQATFSPAIWAEETDRWYQSNRIWNVPSQIEPGETWQIKVCFATDFMRVPMPANSSAANCQCVFSTTIPE